MNIRQGVGKVLSYFLGNNWSWMVGDWKTGAWQQNLQPVQREDMLAFSAVYACLSLISGDISTVRPCVVKKSGKIWVEADPTSPFWKILRNPNDYQTWSQFISLWLVCKLLWGNVYVLKLREGRTMVKQIHILAPQTVQTMVAPDGSVWYRLGMDLLAQIPKSEDIYQPASEMIHDRGICPWHPLVGIPPVYACALSVAQGRAIQQGSSSFFQNMARPSGHLTAPGKIDDETAKRLKKDFEDGFSGKNVGRLLVTGSDLKYQTFTVIPPDQAQLIEQLKWTLEDVAVCFHVPPFKLGRPASTAAANSGMLKQEYYDTALRPHIEVLEDLLTQGLEMPADMRVTLDTDDLMRMDPLARAEADAKWVGASVKAVNEVRERENLPPVDGGNVPFLQQQYFPISAFKDRSIPTPAPAPSLPPGKEGAVALMYYRGVYDEDENYEAGDSVTSNGSLWVARANSHGCRPGESPAWQLAVKAGRDRTRRSNGSGS